MRQGPSGSMSKRSSMRSGRGGPPGRGPLRVPPRVPDRPWDVAQGLMAPSEALFASDFWRSAIFQPIEPAPPEKVKPRDEANESDRT